MLVQDAPRDAAHELLHHPHHGPVQLHHGDHPGVVGEQLSQQGPITTSKYQYVSSSVVNI